MPKIIIQAEATEDQPVAVTLAERVVPAEAQSEHYLAQLLERVGWALLDAEEFETRAADTVESAPIARRGGALSPSDQTVRQATRGRPRPALDSRQRRTPR